jgi:phosphoribosylformylglycinamidine (FGAM) synthase-like amidotransferase family enzyme
MAKPRVLILRAPGTNCDLETAYAFEKAGALADRFHIRRLLENPSLVRNYQILCIPGGFSYGDDVAAGKILAVQFRHHLMEVIEEFRQADKLILGICNGFQVLLKTGLIVPPDENGKATATLTWNELARYEDRWVRLEVASDHCVFLHGIEHLELPIAHAEGRFVVRHLAWLDRLAEAGQIALRYALPDDLTCRATCNDANTVKARTEGIPSAGRTAVAVGETSENAGATSDWRRPLPYPWNPNGSMGNIAGVCDRTGRVLGLMPHPERFIDPTHHPRWTRGEWHDIPHGLRLFANAVAYFS